MRTPEPPPLAEDLEALLRRLRLPHIRRSAPEVIATARAQRWEPAEVLRTLLGEELAGPSATNLSWATSARTLPCDASTHSSILGRYASISCSRRAGICGVPSSRTPTQWATVLGEQPASSPASRKLRVRSNASRISMISSSDFTCSSSVDGCFKHAHHTGEECPGGGLPGQRSIDLADLVAATAQFSWPPAFSSLPVSVQDLMAADRGQIRLVLGVARLGERDLSEVPPSRRPVYVTAGKSADLYVRLNNSTRLLDTAKAVDYIAAHWR